MSITYAHVNNSMGIADGSSGAGSCLLKTSQTTQYASEKGPSGQCSETVQGPNPAKRLNVV